MSKKYKKVEDYDQEEVEKFYDYVFEWYGEGGLIPPTDKNQEPLKLFREDIKKYCNQYIENYWNRELLPYQSQHFAEQDEANITDSVDREMVLNLIERYYGYPLTNPFTAPPTQSEEWKEFHKRKDGQSAGWIKIPVEVY